jgi:acyl-CoA synthetase (AMP-forming)/AMP-acid ligase II
MRPGAARIDFGRQDKVFNVLPVFHSFGLTVGTMLPLVSGVPIYLYPSPLHYRIVPELIYGVNATICSAPTRSWPAMRAPRTPTTSARCATSWPAPSR